MPEYELHLHFTANVTPIIVIVPSCTVLLHTVLYLLCSTRGAPDIRPAGYPGRIFGLFPYPVSGRIPDIALPDIRSIGFLALKKPAFIGIYWLFYGNNLFLAFLLHFASFKPNLIFLKI